MGKGRRKSAIIPPSGRAEEPTRDFSDLWIYAVLFLGIFATYYQVREFSFVEYDDPDYSLSPHVRAGLTADALRWSVTSGEESNWLPVTRVSHLIDAQLFGLQSGGPHLTNVLLHSLAALLLFAFLRRSTGARWRSALVALLFGIHPLHVESVAWVAERKDVLSAVFWFLTLWMYTRYAERPALPRYLLVLFVFSLGLMSKPMVVTLPFVLLLLDIWPLRRLPAPGLTAPIGDARIQPVPWKTVLWEKIPFLALSAGVATIAYLTQKSTGSVDMIRVPAGLRVENALVSYVVYSAKMFWPSNLAVLYPYPSSIPLWQAVCAGLALAGITTLALWRVRDFPYSSFPYLFLGWFWYLGTLAPVIGLVQIGLQSHADRYTYIPMVGLFLILSWGAADVVQRWPSVEPAVVSLVAAGCVLALAATQIQLPYWKDSEALYKRAIAVTSGNYTMHYGLGVVLAKNPNRVPEAIAEYRAAVAAKPEYWEARDNLGTLLLNIPGHISEAIEQYEAAVRIKPDSAELHNNLGNALSKTSGRRLEAVAQYWAAIRIQPDFVEAHTGLGDTLSTIPGRLPEAVAQYEAALRIRPDSAELHNNLGAMLAREPGHTAQAIAQYEAALRIKPSFIGAHYNLGLILSTLPDRTPDAIAQFETVLRAGANPQVRQMVERLRSTGQPF
jgi:tetratricopeptide (TPR) repeat protein